jgi:uncharacterized protein with HEPN domain
VKSSDPSLYLTHILESIEFAQSYVAGIDYIGFSENQQLQDAIVRRIEFATPHPWFRGARSRE